MELNKKAMNTYFYTIALMLASPFFWGSLSYANSEAEAAKLMQEFMDLNIHPQKTFAEYIAELIKLLEGNTAFNAFRIELQTMKDCKDLTKLLLFFKRQENKLPQSLKALFKHKKKTELISIMKRRVR